MTTEPTTLVWQSASVTSEELLQLLASQRHNQENRMFITPTTTIILTRLLFVDSYYLCK